MQKRSAISKINRSGILLVFPINNRPEPESLWSQFFPKTPMKWEWNEDSDDRIGDMWLLMKALSDCREVVYSKWYQGRATFFSRPLFTALLKTIPFSGDRLPLLSIQAREMLEILGADSPLSTKELKARAELQGKLNEPFYNRGVKDLFMNLLTVGFGEVEDGAFPSLAIGATRLIYEDLWLEAEQMSKSKAEEMIDKNMPQGSLVRRYLEKILK
jgi:hypothetical protein